MLYLVSIITINYFYYRNCCPFIATLFDMLLVCILLLGGSSVARKCPVVARGELQFASRSRRTAQWSELARRTGTQAKRGTHSSYGLIWQLHCLGRCNCNRYNCIRWTCYYPTLLFILVSICIFYCSYSLLLFNIIFIHSVYIIIFYYPTLSLFIFVSIILYYYPTLYRNYYLY